MNTHSIDENPFLNRLTKITEDNLTNDQFGVTELAREMGMSRSYVHRHLKALTNQSETGYKSFKFYNLNKHVVNFLYIFVFVITNLCSNFTGNITKNNH